MGNWSLEQTSAPSEQPVSISDAKHHCRIETSADDSYMSGLIKAATQRVQQMTGRQLVTATWKLRMDRWYEVILLPRPPVQSVTSIEYTDTSGTTQTVDSGSYDADTHSEPARITEAWGETWPTAQNEINAVTVTYDAGYGTADDVPETLKQAMYLLIGHYYENREQTVVGAVSREIPRGVRDLCRPHSVSNYGDVYPGSDLEAF